MEFFFSLFCKSRNCALFWYLSTLISCRPKIILIKNSLSILAGRLKNSWLTNDDLKHDEECKSAGTAREIHELARRGNQPLSLFPHSCSFVSKGSKLHCGRMSENEEGCGAYEALSAQEHPRLSNLHSASFTVLLSLEAVPANCLSCSFLPDYEAKVASCQHSSSAAKHPEVRIQFNFQKLFCFSRGM